MLHNETPLSELPMYWRRQIKNLRAENTARRMENTELRSELENAQWYIAQLEADAVMLREGIDPRSGVALLRQ